VSSGSKRCAGVNMWTLLLNPKNLAIIGLSIALLVVSGLWQWQRIHAGNLQNQVDSLDIQVKSLRIQIETRDSVIDDQKKNIELIKKNYEEIQQAKEKTTIIRKNVKELVYVPTGKACASSDELGVDYAKVANDITAFIRSGVRGKVTAPRPNSD